MTCVPVRRVSRVRRRRPAVRIAVCAPMDSEFSHATRAKNAMPKANLRRHRQAILAPLITGRNARYPARRAGRVARHTRNIMSLNRRMLAELFGTFWLVFGGCGSAVLAAGFPKVGIGLLGVSLAFGLTVLTMAYAIGHISGCHLNPAVSIGLAAAKRFPAKELPAYIAAQVIGGIAAAGVLYVIASGAPGFSLTDGLAANGYGEEHS